VYPGIHLVLGTDGEDLRYDFLVEPGADPTRIQVAFPDAEDLRLEAVGHLSLRFAGRELRQLPPRLFQEGREISGRYILTGSKRVGFRPGPYDRRRRLLIDPVLSYSTFLGGFGIDEGRQIAVDAAGNMYVAGETVSDGFPTASAYQSRRASNFWDAFVSKLSPEGRLIYSTYFGGPLNDAAMTLRVDGAGYAYLAGWTQSATGFPTTAGALQRNFGGGAQDGFVARFNPDGTLSWSTLLGGSGVEHIFRLALDSGNAVYVTGLVDSTDFPTTPGAYRRTLRGGDYDAFVAKLAPAGNSLVYATLLGGRDSDAGFGLAVDAAGSAYVTGETYSTDFPTTSGALRIRPGRGFDGFLAKLNPAGAALVYSTLVGGGQNNRSLDVAVDAGGNAYLTGWTASPDLPTTPDAAQPSLAGGLDAFVAKVNPAGTGLVWSTFLGGGSEDLGTRLAVDAEGHVYLTGSTASENFPTVGPLQRSLGGGRDVFLTIYGPAGNLVSSTFLGASGEDRNSELALDRRGNVFLTGGTDSSRFPITGSALRNSIGGGFDAFVSRVDVSADVRALAVAPPRIEFRALSGTTPAPQTVRLTTTPGSPPGWTVEARTDSGGTWLSVSPARGSGAGSLEVTANSRALALGRYTGRVLISNLTTGGRQTVEVELIVIPPVGPITQAGVVNAASFQGGPLAPGLLVTIFGVGLGPEPLAGLRLTPSGLVDSFVGGVRVLIDGLASPMVYAQARQVSAIVPFGVAGKSRADLYVEYEGYRTNIVSLPVTTAAPGLFTLNATGRGPGAVLHPDYSVNSATNPAPRGSVIILYGTGAGQTNPAGSDGKLAGEPLPRPVLPVTVRIGGLAAEVLYAGSAPGLVEGVLQVNARVPAGVTPGSAVPVQISVGSFSSQEGVTVAVR
jgi:uncharacterized protein (TIGR03437 family)